MSKFFIFIEMKIFNVYEHTLTKYKYLDDYLDFKVDLQI